MQDYKEIVEEIMSNTRKIEELKRRNWDIRHKDVHNQTEHEQNLIDMECLELRNKVLTDNARRSAIEYLVPIFAEIIVKYKGKQYGTKTKEKIADMMQERTGFRVYLTESLYSTEIYFYGLYAYQYSFFGRANTKLELTARYRDGNRPQILSGNTIQEFDANDWYLSYCTNYVDDVDERINAIMDARQKAKEAYVQAEQAFSALNALVPSSIDYLYPNTFKGYFDR